MVHSDGQYIVDPFARETNLKKKRSVKYDLNKLVMHYQILEINRFWVILFVLSYCIVNFQFVLISNNLIWLNKD